MERPANLPNPFLHFTIKRMVSLAINNQTYFFSVSHITSKADQLIYGINLNNDSYYFSKTLGINDCKQLDCHTALDKVVLDELCSIITEIELAYQSRPSLTLINLNIFRILGRLRNPPLFGNSEAIEHLIPTMQ